jgi:hypothetical protein
MMFWVEERKKAGASRIDITAMIFSLAPVVAWREVVALGGLTCDLQLLPPTLPCIRIHSMVGPYQRAFSQTAFKKTSKVRDLRSDRPISVCPRYGILAVIFSN